jgi:hypothetical protein
MDYLGYVLLCCDIPLCLYNTLTRAETVPINAQLYCSNYKWQLHIAATQQPSSGCLCEKYIRKSYTGSLYMVKND